jgi:RNA polymerase sigma-70 factor (ECF subfamily)
MTDDQTLIRQFLGGERRAFEPLVERYQKAVYNVALRMSNDPDDAADITQNVFIKASEKLGTYDPKYKFFSWIYRIAVNESINFVEAAKRGEALHEGLVSGERDPDEIAQAEMLSESISQGLLELGKDGRIVIILRHFEELTYEEIGSILDLPVKTVKSRLFTARQSLKKILEQRLER